MKPILSAIFLSEYAGKLKPKDNGLVYYFKFKGMFHGHKVIKAELFVPSKEMKQIIPQPNKTYLCHITNVTVKDKILYGQLNSMKEV